MPRHKRNYDFVILRCVNQPLGNGDGAAREGECVRGGIGKQDQTIVIRRRFGLRKKAIERFPAHIGQFAFIVFRRVKRGEQTLFSADGNAGRQKAGRHAKDEVARGRQKHGETDRARMVPKRVAPSGTGFGCLSRGGTG